MIIVIIILAVFPNFSMQVATNPPTFIYPLVFDSSPNIKFENSCTTEVTYVNVHQNPRSTTTTFTASTPLTQAITSSSTISLGLSDASADNWYGCFYPSKSANQDYISQGSCVKLDFSGTSPGAMSIIGNNGDSKYPVTVTPRTLAGTCEAVSFQPSPNCAAGMTCYTPQIQQCGVSMSYVVVFGCHGQ